MLSSHRIQSLIETDDSLVTFKADTSLRSSPAAAYLRELGAPGIPLIIVDGPGLNTPLQAGFYTEESLIEMIERARQNQTAGQNPHEAV